MAAAAAAVGALFILLEVARLLCATVRRRQEPPRGEKCFWRVVAPSLPEAANLAPIVQDVFQLPPGDVPHPL